MRKWATIVVAITVVAAMGVMLAAGCGTIKTSVEMEPGASMKVKMEDPEVDVKVDMSGEIPVRVEAGEIPPITAEVKMEEVPPVDIRMSGLSEVPVKFDVGNGIPLELKVPQIEVLLESIGSAVEFPLPLDQVAEKIDMSKAIMNGKIDWESLLDQVDWEKVEKTISVKSGPGETVEEADAKGVLETLDWSKVLSEANWGEVLKEVGLETLVSQGKSLIDQVR